MGIVVGTLAKTFCASLCFLLIEVVVNRAKIVSVGLAMVDLETEKT